MGSRPAASTAKMNTEGHAPGFAAKLIWPGGCDPHGEKPDYSGLNVIIVLSSQYGAIHPSLRLRRILPPLTARATASLTRSMG